ncbi:MAG: helix-turn-helix transcriptional regulator [Rhodospirillaceae bacterium]|nr:helix-turn-helix transcriptional regulator [Rhodospirillaceae bacterium]
MSVPMLQHADVWRGIDKLAAKHGLSASGLARRAGLDPTAFNPSKRITREGRPRWPSTESLSKILTVTGEPFVDFVLLTGASGSDASSNGHGGAAGFDQPAAGGRVVARTPANRAIPVISLDRLAAGDCFDSAGQPTGPEWGHLDFAGATGRETFGVEVTGADFDPVFRDGDTLIASRAAEVRRNDRIIVVTASNHVLVRKVARHDADGYYLEAIRQPGQPQFVPQEQVRFAARILWVSQ